MAGGTAGDIRTPYPKGDNSLIPIHFPMTVVASKTKDFISHSHKLKFACRPVLVEFTAQDIIVTNAVTINLLDDSSTPQEIVTDQTLAAITGGAGGITAPTMASGAKALTLNAGAILEASYGSGASDSTVDGVMTLWVRPIF